MWWQRAVFVTGVLLILAAAVISEFVLRDAHALPHHIGLALSIPGLVVAGVLLLLWTAGDLGLMLGLGIMIATAAIAAITQLLHDMALSDWAWTRSRRSAGDTTSRCSVRSVEGPVRRATGPA